MRAHADASSTTKVEEGYPATSRSGPWLLWFAVLGGPVAWALHLFAAWSVVELTCTAGNRSVLSVSLVSFAALATAIPGVVALAALAAAWHARRVLRSARKGDGGEGGRNEDGVAPRLQRSLFMAEVAFWSDILSVLMIVFGAAAVALLSPCGT